MSERIDRPSYAEVQAMATANGFLPALEAAIFIGMGGFKNPADAIRARARRRHIAYHRGPGGSYLFAVEDLNAYLERNRTEARVVA